MAVEMHSNEVTEVTRRAIMDFLRVSGLHWWGSLSEHEFLNRLYDLSKMPSTDSRYANAAGDILQHRDSFLDWDDDWVFHDERFNFLWGPDTELLRFLCETVHPLVCSDGSDIRTMVEEYNRNLRLDGWELYRESEISGRPVYGSRRIGSRIQVFPEPTGWDKVDRQMENARSSLHQAEQAEEFQTIGILCRETLISLSQTVYDAERHGSLNDKERGVKPMLDKFFSVELKGKSSKEARALAKAAFNLANAVQHSSTADFRRAALCTEATASVINMAAILSGRRDPTPPEG